MRGYIMGTNREIDQLQQDLDTITNLTQGADETIQHIKDSVTVAQKSSPAGERWRHKVSLVTMHRPVKKQKNKDRALIKFSVGISIVCHHNIDLFDVC